jgi:hypothetical protein
MMRNLTFHDKRQLPILRNDFFQLDRLDVQGLLHAGKLVQLPVQKERNQRQHNPPRHRFTGDTRRSLSRATDEPAKMKPSL